MIDDTLSIVLKNTGGIIAGFYGIYATLTDFREEKDGKKKLTRKGYVGLALLLVSTILTLSTGAIKDYQDAIKDYDNSQAQLAASKIALEKERKQQDLIYEQLRLSQDSVDKLNSQLLMSEGTAIKLNYQLDLSRNISADLKGAATTIEQNAHLTRNVLAETERLLQPLDDVRFSYVLKIAPTHPLFRVYRSELPQRIQSLLPTLPHSDAPLNVPHLGYLDRSRVLRIPLGSSLFPKEGTAEYNALRLTGFLDLYRKALAFQQGPILNKTLLPPSDLTLFFTEEDKATRRALEYNLDDGSLSMATYHMPSNKEFWQRRGGTVVSIKDLLESQLIIQFLTDSTNRASVEQFELDAFVVYVSGRLFLVEGHQATQIVDPLGKLMYVVSGSQLKEM